MLSVNRPAPDRGKSLIPLSISRRFRRVRGSVYQLPVHFGANGHLDEVIDHIADHARGWPQFDPFTGDDVALNGPVEDHFGDLHASLHDPGRPDAEDSSRPLRGQNVALDPAIEVETAREIDVTDNPGVDGEQGPNLRLMAACLSEHRTIKPLPGPTGRKLPFSPDLYRQDAARYRFFPD